MNVMPWRSLKTFYLELFILFVADEEEEEEIVEDYDAAKD